MIVLGKDDVDTIPAFAKFGKNGEEVVVISKEQLRKFGIKVYNDKYLFNPKTGQYAFLNTDDMMTLIGSNVTHYNKDSMMVNDFKDGPERIYYNLKIVMELLNDTAEVSSMIGKNIYVRTSDEDYKLTGVYDLVDNFNKADKDQTTVDSTYIIEPKGGNAYYMNMSALSGQASNFIYFKSKVKDKETSAFIVYRPNTSANLIDTAKDQKVNNNLRDYLKEVYIPNAAIKGDAYLAVKNSIMSNIFIGSEDGKADLIEGNYKYEIYILSDGTDEGKAKSLAGFLNVIAGGSEAKLAAIKQIVTIRGFGDGKDVDNQISDIIIDSADSSNTPSKMFYEHTDSGNLYVKIGEKKDGKVDKSKASIYTAKLKNFVRQNFMLVNRDNGDLKIVYRKARYFEATPETHIPLEVYANDAQEFGRLERDDNKTLENFKVIESTNPDDEKREIFLNKDYQFPFRPRAKQDIIDNNIIIKQRNKTTGLGGSSNLNVGLGTIVEGAPRAFSKEAVAKIAKARTQWEILNVYKEESIKALEMNADKKNKNTSKMIPSLSLALENSTVGYHTGTQHFNYALDAMTRDDLLKIDGSRFASAYSFYNNMQFFRGSWIGLAYDKNDSQVAPIVENPKIKDMIDSETGKPIDQGKFNKAKLFMYMSMGEILDSSLRREVSYNINFVPLVKKGNVLTTTSSLSEQLTAVNYLPSELRKDNISGDNVFDPSKLSGLVYMDPLIPTDKEQALNPSVEELKSLKGMQPEEHDKAIYEKYYNKRLEYIKDKVGQQQSIKGEILVPSNRNGVNIKDTRYLNDYAETVRKTLGIYKTLEGTVVGSANIYDDIVWMYKPSVVIPAGNYVVNNAGALIYLPYKKPREEIAYCADIVNSLVARMRNLAPQSGNDKEEDAKKFIYYSDIPQGSVVELNTGTEVHRLYKLSESQKMGEGKVSWIPTLAIRNVQSSTALANLDFYSVIYMYMQNVAKGKILYNYGQNKIGLKRILGKGLGTFPTADEMMLLYKNQYTNKFIRPGKYIVSAAEFKDSYNLALTPDLTTGLPWTGNTLDIQDGETSSETGNVVFKVYYPPTISVSPMRLENNVPKPIEVDADGKMYDRDGKVLDPSKVDFYRADYYFDVSRFQVDKDSSYVKYLQSKNTPADEIRAYIEDIETSNLDAQEYTNNTLLKSSPFIKSSLIDVITRVIIPTIFILAALYVLMVWIFLHFNITIEFIEFIYNNFRIDLTKGAGVGWLYEDLKFGNVVVMMLALGFFGVAFANGTIQYVVLQIINSLTSHIGR